MTPDEERGHLARLRTEMFLEFSCVTREDVDARFDALVDEFAGAPVRTFIPVLVRRRLRAELSADD